MRKHILTIFVLMLFLLTGCSNYTYKYELTLKNYEEYIKVSHSYNPFQSKEEEYVTIKDKDAVLNNVKIEYEITQKNQYSTDLKKSYTHTYKKDSELKVKVSVVNFTRVDNVSVKAISGKILTNTSHELDYKESKKVKKEIENLLKPFKEANELTLETSVEITVGKTKAKETFISNIRLDPFYYSEFYGKSGLVIYDEENKFIVHETGKINDINYYRLLGNYDSLVDINNNQEDLFGFDLSDDYFYSFEYGTYRLNADTETIFNKFIKDEETLKTLLEFYKENKLIIKYSFNNNILTEKMELNFDGGTILISLVYNIDNFELYDFARAMKQPPNNKELVNEITDFSVLNKNQLINSNSTNYYMIQLTNSDYIFEINSFYDFELYYLDGTKVNLVKSVNPLYEDKNNVFTLRTGTYILGIINKAEYNSSYSFRIVKASS